MAIEPDAAEMYTIATMSSHEDIIKRIEARNAEIDAQIEQLKAEKVKNATALEVVAALGAVDVDDDVVSSGEERIVFQAANNVRMRVRPSGPPRPEGLPSTWEMVEAALLNAGNEGGLTSVEIIQFIEKKWWPGLKSHQILPQVYGFLKDENKGLYKTDDGRFHIAKTLIQQ